MPVRTKELGAVRSAAVATKLTVYTCPADMTAIVKDAAYWNGSAIGQALVLSITRGGVEFYVWAQTLASNEVLVDTPRFIVLEPGDVLSLHKTLTGTAAVWVSGSELEGVAT